MARAAKPRPLSLTVSAGADGVPFISNVDFCSPLMSEAWNRTFRSAIVLNEEGEPTVLVGIADAAQDWVPITKSPFTGGDIIVSVDEKSYDAVVAALQAVTSPTEDVPELFEDENDADSDQDEDDQEGDSEDDFEDEDADEDLEDDADSEDLEDDEDDWEDEEEDD
jgi:hypothetical protein